MTILTSIADLATSEFVKDTADDDATSIPYRDTDMLKLLKKTHNGHLLSFNEHERKQVKWFFTECIPLVAGDWAPNKNGNWKRRGYTDWVSTSDEVMALWLLRHNPVVSKTNDSYDSTNNPTAMTYKKFNKSIMWHYRTNNEMKSWKKNRIAGRTTEERLLHKESMDESIYNLFKEVHQSE